MNPKTTVGLLVAVVIAIGALWWAQSSERKDAQKADAGPRAIFDPAPEDVRSFEIVQAASGQAIKTEKNDEDKWQLSSPISG